MTMPPVRRAPSAPVVAGGADSLARLNDLTLEELRAEWRRLYRSSPPRLSPDLMRRATAYRIQGLRKTGSEIHRTSTSSGASRYGMLREDRY